ncbi:MAG: hypothetical protein NT131_05230 [Methanomassiliicoccales archaeon]|nr:hypothetical protein [Methanomassiliicoccales archaeon]
MFSVGEIFYNTLSPLGLLGVLICVFLLFYIDAIVFPTLPELFVVLFFVAGYGSLPDETLWALFVAVIALAEVAGLTTLYLVVRRLRVPPKIANAVDRYRRFLIWPDERMILLNRVAPLLPFTGAFVAICNWDYKRSVLYLVMGGVLKYGFILTMSSYFLAYFERGMATDVTVVMVLIIIAISFVVSVYRKRKAGNNGPGVAGAP